MDARTRGIETGRRRSRGLCASRRRRPRHADEKGPSVSVRGS